MNTLFYKQNIWKDPFAETPAPPSHYHPTHLKPLTAKDKQTKLQPEDHTKQKKTKECENASPKEKTFLDKGHSYISRELPTHDTPSPGNNSSKFDESWPSSERPSTLDSPYNSPNVVGTENQTSGASAYSKVLPFENGWNVPGDGRQSTVKPSLTSSEHRSMKGHPSWNQSGTRDSFQHVEQKKPAGSTIARYIDRFRYGEPSSREDRKRDKNSGKGQDFWWLQQSDSPSSAFQTSTPTDGDSDRGRRKTGARLADPPVKGSRTSGSSGSYLTSGAQYESDSSSFLAPDSTDRQTTDIQRRANALIERSESSFSNESIVSGQPSNLFPIQSHPPVSMPRPSNAPPEYTNRTHFPMQSGMHGSSRPATRKTPEDDILYQWRLRRKLEQARDKSTKLTEPISALASRSNPQRQRIDARSKDDVDTKLSEFRERLRHQEQVSSLGLPNPSRNQTSYGTHDVRNAGNDPIPQTIATQTNGMSQDIPEINGMSHDRVELDQLRVREPSLDENILNFNDTVRIASPKHPHILNAKPGVQPHLHMSCDIIPCHDVEHHDRTREQEKTESVRSLMKPQKMNHINDEEASGGEEKKSGETFASEKDVDRGKRGRTQKEIHRVQQKNRLQGQRLHGLEQEYETVPEVQKAPSEVMENSIGDSLEDTIANIAAGRSQQIVTSSPISSTIGKVVSDRLFSTPQRSVSPCSSVDSLPSMHSSSSRRELVNEVKDDVSDDVSSGEFSDDELLQVLRQKREAFEEDLREIDQRLNEFQD